MPVSSVLLLMFWIGLYYAPFIAFMVRRRRDPTRGPSPAKLFLLNALTGWTVIGWFASWYLAFPEMVPTTTPAPAKTEPPEWFTAERRTCSQCGGTGRMTCPVCKGMGQQTDCTYCTRSGTVQCTAVHGL